MSEYLHKRLGLKSVDIAPEKSDALRRDQFVESILRSLVKTHKPITRLPPDYEGELEVQSLVPLFLNFVQSWNVVPRLKFNK